MSRTLNVMSIRPLAWTNSLVRARLRPLMQIWTDILRGFNPDSSYLFRIHRYRRPWALRFQCIPEGMGFSIIPHGRAYMRSRSMKEPLCLETGDLVFRIRGFEFDIASDVSAPVQHVWPDCGDDRRSPGHFPVASIVCGGYRFRDVPMHPLFDDMPPVVIISAAEIEATPPLKSAIQLFLAELDRDESIPDTVRVPLVEVVLHHVLRHWIEHHSSAGSRGPVLKDPHLYVALKAMSGNVAKEWTVDELARASGLSRAAFASRFKHVIGDTPAHYLTRLRVQRAMNLLKGTDTPLVQIAQEVGYADAFAFSKAFKRIEGRSPTAYRRAG
jgi:AraC-like DNA-binding protein